MFPRLYLARKLLTEDGVIFISIDENEIAQIKLMCDEIFGEENFIETISWNKRIPKNDKGIGNIHEYILIYVKDQSIKHEFLMMKDGLDEIYELVKKLKKSKSPLSDAENEIKKLYKKNGYDRGITLYNRLDFEYKLWGKINMSWPNANTFGPNYEVLHPLTNKPVKIPDRGWRWKRETFNSAVDFENNEYGNIKKLHDGSILCNKIWFAKDENTQPSSVTFLDEVNTFLLRSILSLKSDGGLEVEKVFGKKGVFSYPKPTSLLKILANSVSLGKNDIILDFFSGSATTAHAVNMLNLDDERNRKWIMVQLNESLDSKKSKIAVEFCKNNNLPAEITSIGIQRIKKANKQMLNELEAKNEEGFNRENLEKKLGFKIFSIDKKIKELEEMKEFTSEIKIPEPISFIHNDKLDLIHTYKLQDGNFLNTEIEKIKFSWEKHVVGGDGTGIYIYEAYRVGDILYLIDSINSNEVLKGIIEKIDNDPEFKVNKIVLYGFTNTNGKYRADLLENIHNYNNKKGADIEVEVRY